MSWIGRSNWTGDAYLDGQIKSSTYSRAHYLETKSSIYIMLAAITICKRSQDG